MADIEDLVAKFKKKIDKEQHIEKQDFDKIEPLAVKVFNERFANIFKNISEELNRRIGVKIINFQPEGKNKFFIQGQYHRIYFQKNRTTVEDGIISVSIIPIYVWKGITKHLGPITFFINQINESVKWDITFNSPEEYSKNIFAKLIDDEDFSM